MKTIRVSYKGPTNTRGSGWLVTDDDGNRMFKPCVNSQSDDGRADAVRAFCNKLGWTGELVEGMLGKDRTFTWADGPRLTV